MECIAVYGHTNVSNPVMFPIPPVTTPITVWNNLPILGLAGLNLQKDPCVWLICGMQSGAITFPHVHMPIV